MKRKRPSKSTVPPATRNNSAAGTGADSDFLITAIGASAGGIEAFTELIKNLQPETGMAFVLIQHLDPKHHSLLTELMSKETSIRVSEVTDGMAMEPDHVYVIPPNTTMSIYDHALRLSPRDETHAQHMPIDHFMRSLAEHHGNRAIGVILSGSGSDGTLGMREIQAHGGVTFVQDETTAKYDGMPRSAIAAGCVDYIQPPRIIARELARIARHPYVARGRVIEGAAVPPEENSTLATIFKLLRKTTGLDFTHYRQTTVWRRIQRRMVVHKVDKLEEYVKYVQANPAEINALYHDMLINVTSFFRNPGMFDVLKTQVFPRILKNHPPEVSLRVWTPGCASGEETYSLAITLLECLGDKTPRPPIQFFGTDVSEVSVSKARAGTYPENIQGDVSDHRLRRFFTKVESGYRIAKSLRDVCIFAQHDLLSDPPFSQMDVICCRNLLIYLEPMLQNKVISVFHYALRPSGFLVLGSSEGIGPAANSFTIEDRSHKIFSRRTVGGRAAVTFSLPLPQRHVDRDADADRARLPESNLNFVEAQKEFDRRLLSQYTPAAVLINEDMEIVLARGNVSRYLKLAPGRASLNILKMAREGLMFDLRNAVARAQKEHATIRRQKVQIKNGNARGSDNGHPVQLVNFEVIPFRLTHQKELFLMVIFEEVPAELARKTGKPASVQARNESRKHAKHVGKLEDELAATKEYLNSVIEGQEATNEELQSANEEILSSNEELQSTNEELETAKEELQSTNEELTTVNDELRSRNQEVSLVNSDLTNLLSSISIPVVMLGSDLTIRRFTPVAQKLLGLIPGDVGRPFLNINPAIQLPDFRELVSQVMMNFETVEKEVSDRSGKRYSLRILPYRTLEGQVDGAVVTLMAAQDSRTDRGASASAQDADAS
jgi:two-component system CheB/CheR fusion protein